MLATLEVSLWPREIPSRMQLSQIPHFQSRIFFLQSCNWIICQSSHTLKTHQHISSSRILQTHFQSLQMHPPLPTNTSSKTNLNAFAPNFCHLILLIRFFFYLPRLRSWSIYIPAPVFTNSQTLQNKIYKLTSASESKQCSLDSILILFSKLCFNEVGPILTNLVNLSLSGGIFPSSLKQALVQPLLKNHLCPLIHWSISIHWWSQQLSSQFQTSTSSPKCSKESLLPTFDLTCPLTLCLLFNLLTGSFILLKLLFLKFTMTSTLK